MKKHDITSPEVAHVQSVSSQRNEQQMESGEWENKSAEKSEELSITHKPLGMAGLAACPRCTLKIECVFSDRQRTMKRHIPNQHKAQETLYLPSKEKPRTF